MSLTLTIGGVDKTAFWYLPSEPGQLAASIMSGSRGPIRLVVYDLDGASGYRPTLDQEVSVTDGAATIAGVIDDVEEEPMSDLDTGVKTIVSASDFHSFPDRVYIQASYNAGTSLRTVAADILAVSGLDDLGVTLSAAAFGTLPNGPLMVATTTFDSRVTDAFNKLQALTGYIWRISATKELLWREPAWEDCGYSLSDADTTPGVLGTVKVKQSRRTNYTNRVRLTAGPSGAGEPIAHTWNGDGVTTVFALAGENVPASNAWPGVIVVDGTSYPLFPVGSGFADVIEWDYATNDGTVSFLGAFASVATGATNIVLTYTPMYPFVVEVEDAADIAARGPYVDVLKAPDILIYAEAIAAAAAALRIRLTAPRTVTVKTDKGIAYPGQAIALSFAERAVNTTCLITAVDVENLEDGRLAYTLTCVDSAELGESWLDFFRGGDSSGSSGGGTVVVPGGGVGSTTIVTAPIYLGGSRSTPVDPNPAAWTRVPNAMPFVCKESMTLLLRAFVAARTGSVTVRVFDETAAAAALTSAPVSSATFTEVTGSMAAVDGHTYWLEVLNGVAGSPVFGIGQLEGI